jgi:lysophospholipase L1-like esterase
MIYVNGDSWSTWNTVESKEVIWPTQLQKQTEISVYNDSAGCGSNSRIFYNLCNFYQCAQARNEKIDLVIIALSTNTRWHLPARRLSSWSIGPTVRNDRSGACDETILKWFTINVLDDLEFTYQYYNTIWQIDNLCKKTINCPVIFFNGWCNKLDLFAEIFYNKEKTDNWIYSQVEDEKDMFTLNYISAFDYLRNYFKNVNYVKETWENFINDEDRVDGWHPNTAGHQKISNFVLDKIKETYPELKL